jgi:hypothetical protein
LISSTAALTPISVSENDDDAFPVSDVTTPKVNGSVLVLFAAGPH